MTIPLVFDEDGVLELLRGTVRAVGSVLPGNAELVLHDLRQPEYSIAEIANAHVSGRKRGDSVLAGMRADKAFSSAMEEKQELVSLLLDYPTLSREGAPLRSSTAFYRDSNGRAFAALCINVNNSGISDAINLLRCLVGNVADSSVETPQNVESSVEPGLNNIEDLMREIIRGATEQSPGSGRANTKRANLLAVQQMQEKGIFLIKGGVEKAAGALGVTRYTIYNYLDELKSGL
ncbi:TPA: transcriptional regulator [Pseudomonas aeruginosa]